MMRRTAEGATATEPSVAAGKEEPSAREMLVVKASCEAWKSYDMPLQCVCSDPCQYCISAWVLAASVLPFPSFSPPLPSLSSSVLLTLRHLLHRYPRCRSLLDLDPGDDDVAPHLASLSRSSHAQHSAAPLGPFCGAGSVSDTHTHTPTHSFTPSLTPSVTCSLAHSLTHSLT